MTLLDVIVGLIQLIVALPLLILALPLLIAYYFFLFALFPTTFDPAIIFALWILAFVLAIFLVPALRRRRGLRRIGAIVCLSAASTVALAAILHNVRRLWEASYQQEVARNTYHLDAPRSFDGIDFPAGSKVVLSIKPPHHLVSGEVPVPTRVFGLNVNGAFWVHPPPAANPSAAPRDIWKGTLASSATFRTVPCGPGTFENTGGEGWLAQPSHPYYNQSAEDPGDPDNYRPLSFGPNEVSCTLASNVSIAGVVLRAETKVVLRFKDEDKRPYIFGELAEAVTLNGIACAPGRLSYDDYTVDCISAGNQMVQGFLFAGGRNVKFDNYPPLKKWDLSGTLAEPRDISGLSLPRGTEIDLTSHPNETSSAGASPILELGSIIPPQGEEVRIQGAIVKGRMHVSFYQENGEQSFRIFPADPDPGNILFEGHQYTSGMFDGTRWTFAD